MPYTDPFVLCVASLLGFFLGAVPFAWLVVRLLKGVDIRTVGSGNVGATNASRAFEGKAARFAAFLLIYLLDAAKGLAAVLVLGVAPQFWVSLPTEPLVPHTAIAPVVIGACAVLGHVFTPFLGFRGGKGVATATGVMFALDWQATAIALAMFLVVRFSTRQVFFGSLALGLALPAAAIALHPSDAFGQNLPVTILCFLLAAFLFWTHRSNLRKHFGPRPAGTA